MKFLRLMAMSLLLNLIIVPGFDAKRIEGVDFFSADVQKSMRTDIANTPEECYREVAAKKNVSQEEVNAFLNWYTYECNFKTAFSQALLTDLNVIGELFDKSSQKKYEQIRKENRIVLRSSHSKTKPTIVGSTVIECFVDQLGEAMYVLSVFYEVCKNQSYNINIYGQTAIAYAIVWDAMVHHDIADGSTKNRDQYLIDHMKMYLRWNEKGQLVFDLRDLTWDDIKYIIATANFGGNKTVEEYSLESLQIMHDDFWMGAKDTTYNTYIKDTTFYAYSGRLAQFSKRYPTTGIWSWLPTRPWNCGGYSLYETAVARAIGIPATPSSEAIVFIHQHGTWSNGKPRYAQGHYVTSYKRITDGAWFFGIRSLLSDPIYDVPYEIPGELILQDYEDLSNKYFIENDIDNFELDKDDPQICGEIIAFFRRADTTIAVTSPNGGESWVSGSAHNITWTTTGTVGNIKIEYSVNGGSSWSTIIASSPNTGSYSWNVPNTLSTTCIVKASDAANEALNDVSNAVFSIVAIPAIPMIRLSRSALFLGSAGGNPATGAQTVMIGNSGGGTLNWLVASPQSWISVSPSSGAGTAKLTVSVNPSGLAKGTHTGAINVTAAGAANSPQSVNITLNVYAGGTTRPPFGSFDTPVDGSTVMSSVPVTGWALDDVEVTQVEIKRDPHASDPPVVIGPDGLVFIGNAIFVEGARPDIETGYPDYPLNYKAGWGYMLLTNFLPAGTYKLHAYATDKEGNKVLLGSKTITCSNATAVKPFGTIDTPIQGGDASGNPFLNFGWVLTPMPKTVPKDGSTIEVFVDSVKVGDLKTAPNVYNQYRVDVSTAFPGLNNSNGPVGAFFLDTTKYPNGVHTIHWIATDDQGAADGIGSRYFNVINTGTAAQASSELINLEKADSYEFIMNLPVSFEPRKIKRGFNLKADPEILQPDNYGTVQSEIREVERIEVILGKGSGYRGYLVVGDELRPLPIGSTLDQINGTFSWMPGPGFIGKYDLLFLQTDEFGITARIPVKVTIRPKFEK